MKRTKVFYNVLILLAALLLTACQDQKDIPEVSSPEKNLVLSNHISNQKVKSICEDRYGQIWIGTFRGLNKYDGNQYHQYYCVDDSLGLPDNHITHIYRDSHNRLWVATVNGVCLYQANGNFNRVSINGTNKNIEKILEDKEGRIFFLTMTDLYQYDENTNTAIIKLSKMLEKNCYNYSCHIDRKDVMWIVTSYSVKGYRTQDLKLIVQSPVQSYPIASFLLDGHQLYISGYNGMQLFDTDTRKWGGSLQHCKACKSPTTWSTASIRMAQKATFCLAPPNTDYSISMPRREPSCHKATRISHSKCLICKSTRCLPTPRATFGSGLKTMA